MNWRMALFMFLAGAGVVMTASLTIYAFRLNGNRRVPRGVVALQAMGWILFLWRTAFHIYGNAGMNGHAMTPSWWVVLAVGLMDAGQAGHLWAILKRRHFGHVRDRKEE